MVPEKKTKNKHGHRKKDTDSVSNSDIKHVLFDLRNCSWIKFQDNLHSYVKFSGSVIDCGNWKFILHKRWPVCIVLVPHLLVDYPIGKSTDCMYIKLDLCMKHSTSSEGKEQRNWDLYWTTILCQRYCISLSHDLFF